ncbi:MAG: sigma-54-dependent transcriptional regulator [Candidatus Binatia bacterium]
MVLPVLIIDDEKNIRATLRMCLESMGCQVTTAASGPAALAALARQSFDLAFLDLRLHDTNGLDLLPHLLSESPNLAVVVITAYAAFETAVEAIKRGAADYLPKPFTPAQIRHVVEQTRARQVLRHRLQNVEGQLHESVPEIDLETTAPIMRIVLDTVMRAAKAEATVLLHGESGTGKGVLARMLHMNSPRAAGPFVVVNCPTLSAELLASELFGHTKGAFTGAIRDQTGRVEAAQGGTLLLDEIGEIPPELQAKLLRFLQDREFERVGETKTRRADVRVLAATNRNIEADVKAGRFREDLWYRLNVIEIHVPPLRERREDIVRLANRFLAFFARTAGRSGLEFSRPAETALLAYSWPGNIRELRNTIERAVILWPPQVIEPQAFPHVIATHGVADPLLGGDYTLEVIEREHVLRVLARVSVFEEAARILGIDGSTLWRKRKKYEEELE